MTPLADYVDDTPEPAAAVSAAAERSRRARHRAEQQALWLCGAGLISCWVLLATLIIIYDRMA